MKLTTNVLNGQEITTTADEQGKMRLSNDAESRIFEMFTKNIYSDAIGSIVREITSNCFDSHVEAGVTDPVVIKYSFDGVTETHYISFIDFGMGISPERFKDIYTVYFTSTKRDTNEQHGAFGLGAKTPLAYRRKIGLGENEFDNSFILITNYNGIKYTYLIYSGLKSPEYTLMSKEETTERNGSEVKIPILSQDLPEFINAIKQQLFYFENIVYENFEKITDEDLNDYQIYKGKTFLYRPNCPNNFLHISLGRVMYQLDFNKLDLSQYDFNVPVAIQIPIGKIDVTTSREAIDYSKETINYLKNRIDKTMQELKKMYVSQYDNVYTLEDFLSIKKSEEFYIDKEKGYSFNIPFEKLSFEEKFKNFKYVKFAQKLFDNIKIFYGNLFIIKRYGKAESKSYWKVSNDKWAFSEISIRNGQENVYYSEKDYFTEFKANRIKNTYLKSLNSKERIYILFKKEIDKTNPLFLNYNFEDTSIDEVIELQNDLWDYITKKVENYDNVIVPESFKIERKRKEKINWGTKTIMIYINDKRVEISLSLLQKVKRVYYVKKQNIHEIDTATMLYNVLFKDKKDYLLSYSDIAYNKKEFHSPISIAIIGVSQSNIKYFEQMPNAKPIEKIYPEMFLRKLDMVSNHVKYSEYLSKLEEINEKFEDIMGYKFSLHLHYLMPEYNQFNEFIKKQKESNPIYYQWNSKNIVKIYFEKLPFLNIEDYKIKGTEKIKLNKLFKKTEKFIEKNKDILNALCFNSHIEEKHQKILIKILKKFKVI